MNETEQVHWGRWRTRRDEDAFGALVRPHLAFATDFARRLGCGLSDADEVVQRCLVKLSAAKDDRPREVGLRAWMGRTILSEVKMLRRANRRRRTHEGRAPSRDRNRDDAIDLRDQVEALLATLETADRGAVTLRYLHDLEYGEVAYVLGITSGAARTRVHRAIERLRRNLGENAPAMIAALPLLCGTTDWSARSLLAAKTVSAHPWFWITGGVMGVGMKLTIGGAAAALIALLLGGGTSSEDRGPRAARPELVPGEVPEAPVDDPSESVAAEAVATEFRPLPLADGEREAYLADTQIAELIRMNRDMREEAVALFEELGREEEPPRPDPVTRRYLESLVARYRDLPPGTAREEVLRGLSDEIWDYLESTGDTSFLEFVEDVAQDEAGTRILGGLLFATHPDVIALLERLHRHPDAMVRLAALTNLCTSGEHAQPVLLAALEDPSPRVRWSAALFLDAKPEDATPVEFLLDRLETENHPLVALAIGGTVVRLDPVRGSTRLGRRLQAFPGRTEWFASLSELATPSLEALGEGLFPEPNPPTPEPVQEAAERARLVRLIQSYRESKTPEGRLAALEKLGEAHDGFVRRTGSTAHVEFLENVARDAESAEDRAAAARVLRGDLAVLTRLARSPHPEVRREAASNLGRLPFKDHQESLRELLSLLDDPDAHVRMRSAIALAGSSRRTAIPQMLAVLGRELDQLPVIALVQAIERLDPEKGRERILKEIDGSSGDTRVLVLGVLAIRDRRAR